MFCTVAHSSGSLRGSYSRLAEFEALAMEDNVVEWAMKKMKVEDKPTEFDELMGTKKG